VKADSPRWTEVTPSRWPHEKKAWTTCGTTCRTRRPPGTPPQGRLVPDRNVPSLGVAEA